MSKKYQFLILDIHTLLFHIFPWIRQKFYPRSLNTYFFNNFDRHVSKISILQENKETKKELKKTSQDIRLSREKIILFHAWM